MKSRKAKRGGWPQKVTKSAERKGEQRGEDGHKKAQKAQKREEG